jgi:hypothetical protein
MHDLDRTQLEQEDESVYESEYESAYESEAEDEDFLGALVGPATQILGGMFGGELESPFGEMEEVELASELLEVANEEELEDFLGDLIGKAGSAIGSFVSSDTGRALTGALKGVAKKALPTIGQTVGDWIAPGAGGQIGRQLASTAGDMFGLELEGLSAQEAEFEAARGVVRYAGAATRAAAAAPRHMPPRTVARQATRAAAQVHAPGLLRASGGTRARAGMPHRQRARSRAGQYGARPGASRPYGGHQRRRRHPGGGAPAARPGYGARSARPGYGGPAAEPPMQGRGRIAAAYGLPGWVAEPAAGYGYDDFGDGGEPGFVDQSTGYGPGTRRRSQGRWIRQGGTIVLLGV